MGVGSLLLAGASAVSSYKQGKEAKKARKAQERIRQTQSARDRLAQVRQARIAQASIIQAGASSEGSSSTVQGAYSGVGSTLSGNLQFINQMDSLQQEVFQRMQRANSYGMQAANYGAASQLAGQLTSMAMGQAPSGVPTQSTAANTGSPAPTATSAGASGVGPTGSIYGPIR